MCDDDKPSDDNIPPVETSGKRKSRGSGHERVGEIMAVAKELFVSHGIEHVSTRQIARHAGLSQTGLYTYFPTKEELLHAVMNKAFVALDATMQSIVIDPQDAEGSMRRIFKALIRFGLDYPHEYQIAFIVRGKPVTRDQGAAKLNPAGMRAFGILRDFIAASRLNGAISMKSGSADGIAQVIWASVHGLIALLLLRPNFPWVDLEELIETHARLLIYGALSREKSS